MKEKLQIAIDKENSLMGRGHLIRDDGSSKKESGRCRVNPMNRKGRRGRGRKLLISTRSEAMMGERSV